jgi:hypothetical protein
MVLSLDLLDDQVGDTVNQCRWKCLMLCVCCWRGRCCSWCFVVGRALIKMIDVSYVQQLINMIGLGPVWWVDDDF